MNKPAILVLEDGTEFRGRAVGATGLAVGEVVFNTSMTGYQEILTDPSYFRQIVTLTYPHIGNVGTNVVDEESSKPYVQGLVIRDLSLSASNFRNELPLPAYLKRHNIIAIADIDTRKLVHRLRERGAQSGYILAGEKSIAEEKPQKALDYPRVKGVDLAKLVTTKKPYCWSQGSHDLGIMPCSFENNSNKKPSASFHVVVYDYGVKYNILRMLVDRGCRLTVVPAQTSAKEVLSYKPDGVVLSNGPGDPTACGYAIEAVKTLLEFNLPLFGICLGHQLLALACGAKTFRMKYGHHGSNHPVKVLENNRVMISAQNHGFSVDDRDLPDSIYITHRSLFDQTVQGIHHKEKPAFSFQGHPEGAPGPQDVDDLFDHFMQLMFIHTDQKKH